MICTVSPFFSNFLLPLVFQHFCVVQVYTHRSGRRFRADGNLVDRFILEGVRDVEGIAEELRAGVPEILAGWQDEREIVATEDAYQRLVESIGQVLVVFTEFLRSPSPLQRRSPATSVRRGGTLSGS